MTIGANAVWECTTTGNDDNGGFYMTGAGTTDYSLQNAAESTKADIVANGTTTLTSATGDWTIQMVGNGIHLDTPDEYYEIATHVSPTEITVDRIVAANVGITGLVGGSIATIQEFATNMLAGGRNTCWVQGNRNVTTEIDFVADRDPEGYARLLGHGGTRGDGTKVTLTATDGLARFFDFTTGVSVDRKSTRLTSSHRCI